MFYVLAFVAGLIGGWAFFKHRQYVKDKAKAEGLAIVKSIKDKL